MSEDSDAGTDHREPDDGPDEGATTEDRGPPLLRRDRLTAIVLAITVLAIGLRLFDLGGRVAHWQEARLGWWLQEYARTGVYTANPPVGGSLLQVLGRVSTGMVGMGDLGIRAPVAVAGGLLPLGALAFRRRLEPAEVSALAGLLAVGPLLLYYTRFASVDALAAVLALATVATVVALRERPGTELVVAAVFLVVLAVAAEPTAAVAHLLALVLAWGVAMWYTPPSAFDSHEGNSGLPRPIPEGMWTAWRLARPVAVGTGALVLLVLLDPDLPGSVIASLGSPGQLPGVLLAPVGTLLEHLSLVLAQLAAPPSPIQAVVDLLATLGLAAPVVTGLAVVGWAAESWAERPMRPLVTVALAWALLGIPLQALFSGTGAPWVATHVVVALAVPAAVGAVATLRWTRAGLAAGDPLTGGVGLLAVVLAVGVLAATMLSGVYLSPTAPGAAPVQYGQPEQALKGPVDSLAAAQDGDGQADLVFYGAHFVDRSRVGVSSDCVRWHNALPLPWYAAASAAEVSCASSVQTLERLVGEGPTLVVGRQRALGPLADRYENYTARTLRFRAWNANTTVLVHNSGG